MAAKNLVTVKFDRTDADNVEMTFEDTDANLESVIGALEGLNLAGFKYRTLVPRNRYGSKGMPAELKRERLLAALAELEASA